RRPDARFATAGEVARGLERLRTGARAASPTPAARSTAIPGPARPAPATARPATQPRPAKPARRRSKGWIWALLPLLLVIALAAVAIVLASDDSSSGGGNHDGASTASSGQTIPAKSAQSFDPIGGDGEDDAAAPNAIDGNPTTVWSTERYQDFNTN